MSAKVTVFSGPNCVRCTFVKRTLVARGIEFNEIDVSVDEAARERLVQNGHQSLPVVELRDEDFVATSAGNDTNTLDWIIKHMTRGQHE